MTIETLREFRIGGYAVFDLVVSFLGIWLISPFLTNLTNKVGVKIPRKNWLYLTLPISIVTHILVGNMTQMTKNFLDIQNHFVLKLAILGLLFLGLKDVRSSKK